MTSPHPLIPPHVPGQSSHYYKTYGCPHAECRAAATREATATRKRRRDERVWDAELGRLIHPRLLPAGSTERGAKHGTANGYNGYGCCCDPCATAASGRPRHRRREEPAVPVEVAPVIRIHRGPPVRPGAVFARMTFRVPVLSDDELASMSALQWLDLSTTDFGVDNLADNA